MPSTNYSVLVDVDFDVSQFQSKLQQQVNQSFKNGFKFDTSAARKNAGELSQSLDNLNVSANNVNIAGQEAGLTWQQAAAIFDACKTAIGAMVDEVFTMDSALTEFQKVSDLSTASLQNYVDTLKDLGDEVARTG